MTFLLTSVQSSNARVAGQPAAGDPGGPALQARRPPPALVAATAAPPPPSSTCSNLQSTSTKARQPDCARTTDNGVDVQSRIMYMPVGGNNAVGQDASDPARPCLLPVQPKEVTDPDRACLALQHREDVDPPASTACLPSSVQTPAADLTAAHMTRASSSSRGMQNNNTVTLHAVDESHDGGSNTVHIYAVDDAEEAAVAAGGDGLTVSETDNSAAAYFVGTAAAADPWLNR